MTHKTIARVEQKCLLFPVETRPCHALWRTVSMWVQDGEIRRGVELFTISLAVCQRYAADTPRKFADNFVSR
jgi:hypothetical protein